MTENRGPTRPTPPGLGAFWTSPLSEFATLPPERIEPGLQERHRLFSLLTLALVASQFNGNKYGERGDYGAWRSGQLEPGVTGPARMYRGGDYLGHNIAALAVDARGNVVDYDFNHNELVNSSVEHAESRLVRRVFSLAQIFDPWRQWRAGAATGTDAAAARDAAAVEPSAAPRTFVFSAHPDAVEAAGLAQGSKRQGYGTLLADVTIYTSLESCAQCSGIMALANVREVVFLQYDQGQYLIGNLMYRATRRGGAGSAKRPGAPRPIPGSAFGLEWYDRLNAANLDFSERVRNAPFYQEPGFSDTSASVTSFLCTDGALEILDDATATLEAATGTRHRDYRRPDHAGRPVEGALSNAEVLVAVRRFLDYARTQGRRGTQHRV
jgi:tRNA(Arg) A34 adenosine deaminase TadA